MLQTLAFIYLLSKPVKEPIDFERLAYAISCAETSCGKYGSAISSNNCCGLMKWDIEGRRHLQVFVTYEDSLLATARLWESKYKRFPDRDLATRWTGNDKPDRWLAVVNKSYYSQQ